MHAGMMLFCLLLEVSCLSVGVLRLWLDEPRAWWWLVAGAVAYAALVALWVAR